MNTIAFTQYLRPHGRKISTSVECSDDIIEKADAICAAGYKFEVEVLMTGNVSMTVENTDDDKLDLEGGPIAIEIVPNGPGVLDAVVRLVNKAYAAIKG